MKFAHVATKWIGEGTPFKERWRLDLPLGYSDMNVLGTQLVNLAMNCPDPNIGLVWVEESRQKHKGYIDDLKSNLNQVVIETWEDDGLKVPVASPLKLKNFLIRQGMEENLADYIVNFVPEGPRDRMEVLLEELSLADLRSRRRMELGL